MKNKLYVAYGSNLNMRQMAMRCPTAKLYGTGEVLGYELQFKGQPHGAFATIAPVEGKSVPVAVWEIKARDERSLDIYEGYPSHYYKENIPVQINGKTINAMVYIMNQKMTFGIPTQRYYNSVLEGYENCGLDPKILNDAVDNSIVEYRKTEEQLKQSKRSLYHFYPYSSKYDTDAVIDEETDMTETVPDEEEYYRQLGLTDDEGSAEDEEMDKPDETDSFYVSDQMHL